MRIKDIGNINARVLRENTPQDYTFQYIDISSVSSDGQISLSEPMRYDESPSRARRIVKKDDVIVSTVRTYLRAIAGIDWDAKDTIASTGFAVISPDKKNDPAYVKYLMSSDAVVDEICKESTGVSYPAISSSRLSAIQIPVVSLKEQKTISAYLDKQINSINERIWLRERELQTLIKLKQSEINSVVTRGLDSTVPMKDSGIPWIGQIPTHWKVRRIKDIAHLGSGTTPKSGMDKYYENGTIPWLNTSDVQNGIIINNPLFITDKAVEDYPVLRYYPANTVLLAMYGGGTIGNVGLMTYPAMINQACCALITHKGMLPKYLFYYLLSVRGWVISTGFGGTQINLSQKLIAQYFITVPPLDEQKSIVSYLDDTYKRIDESILNINEQINKLKLLKKALINEVISGQRIVE